jgi:hypothetical protein
MTPQPGTPLPWKYSSIEGCVFAAKEAGEPTVCFARALDGDYIVHACNSLPALEARVKELEEGLDEIEGHASHSKDRTADIMTICHRLLSKPRKKGAK